MLPDSGHNGTLPLVSDRSRDPKLDRRSFLAAAGLGAGVIAAGVVGAQVGGRKSRNRSRAPAEGSGSSAATTQADIGGDVSGLFDELEQAGALGEWRIARVHGVHLGAIPVVMVAPGGKRYQIDVLRRDPSGPRGVGNTQSLSLFVSNRGDGDRPTDEAQGLGAIRLAQALDARERQGKPTPSLMTLRERHAAFPNAGFTVSL